MSKKNLDSKGRLRSRIVAFRVSDSEADQLNRAVALSGLTKQDFIIKCLGERSFEVHASTRMRKAFRELVGEVVAELRRLRRAGDMGEELVETLETLAEFAGSFAPEKSPVDVEDALIKNLGKGGA